VNGFCCTLLSSLSFGHSVSGKKHVSLKQAGSVLFIVQTCLFSTQEMGNMDGEIDAYLRGERFVRAAPGAVSLLQASWRARGPRLAFAEFKR
jgi:hypothetical protein